jgi:hypothetical protein
LAEVFAVHSYDTAHFVEAGAHALGDAVAEGFGAGGGSSGGDRPDYAGGWFVFKVCSDYGGAVVVEAGV